MVRSQNGGGLSNGRPNQNPLKDVERQAGKPWPRKDKKQSGLKAMWRKFLLVAPYMWPKGKPLLQFFVIISFVILAAIRFISVLIPIYYKKIVDGLADVDERRGVTVILDSTTQNEYQRRNTPVFQWQLILLFCLLKSTRGTGGFLQSARNILWIKVQQRMKLNLRIKLFRHLHSLSVRWHLHRKTGEVIRVMDRGVNSVNQTLTLILSQILPVIADIIIAVVYFLTVFDHWIGMIVFTTMVGYVVITIVISERRSKIRRKLNETDNERSAASVDSILNYETVKYNAAEEWEVERYTLALQKFQHSEWLVQLTANLQASAQNTIMMIGLMAGGLLSAYYVVVKKFSVGDFVLYMTYIQQLYEPLDRLGAYYRMLQQAFIDMENMFEMLAEQQDVVDNSDAQPLHITNGQVEFRNVSFQYPQTGKSVIKDLSFVVPPGQTYALVGHSGGGKSTISKLLFRLYDVSGGQILIDGQDISKVQQKSLREGVSIVPQDTALFNADIRYNISYGKRTASNEDVEAAAMAADIHHTINNLPQKYSSTIGERGLKLSGGERQRVAIARAIISSPKIIVFDEATSSLDSRTERNIHRSLTRICQNRTTLVIAHRLSTIVHAHQILVLQDGEVAERGTHDDLLNEAGLYAEMWHMQKASAEDGLTSPSLQQPSPAKSISMIQDNSVWALQNGHRLSLSLPLKTNSPAKPSSIPPRPRVPEQEADLMVPYRQHDPDRQSQLTYIPGATPDTLRGRSPYNPPRAITDDPGVLSDEFSDSSSSVTCTNCGVRLPSLSRAQPRVQSPAISIQHSEFSTTSEDSSNTNSFGSHICSQCASLVQSPIEESQPSPVEQPMETDIDAASESMYNSQASVWKPKKKHSVDSDGDMEQFLSMSMAYGMGHDVRMCETSNSNLAV